jgi:TonB-linked SusC/RagA family outer membrane protein
MFQVVTSRFCLIKIFLIFIIGTVHAQEIKGRVVDSMGNGLEGATITVLATNERTVSNENGYFSIQPVKSIPSGSIIRFSFTGYALHDHVFTGNTSLEVVLKPVSKDLSEIVVTALGIKRAEKSLGFAAQTVKDNAVTDARTNNWVNSLTGKVAGLNIQGTGAGPMGSSRITLRGESSLNLDNNQALIILDGVPVSNKISGTGFTSHLSQDSPVDYGSAVSDINPDDIENITVLKGAGATALYGSRAAAGVIIVTTKSGSGKRKGLGVTYNTTLSMDEVNRWPDYQFEYGEGRTSAYYSYGNTADGLNTATGVAAGRAWGPKFNGQMYFQYDPKSPNGIGSQRTPWVANPDYISGFFRKGITTTNSISLEGGTGKTTARMSVTHMKNKWILPNTGYERINASLSVNSQVSDRLRINGKMNYTNKRSDNLPAAGYNNQTIMYFLIIGTAPNIRPEWFKPWWEEGLVGVKQRNIFNPGPDNPYLDLYEMLNKMNKHGVVGNLTATYQINPNLDFQLRTGIDMSYEFRSQQRPFSMTKYPRGMYREQAIFNYEQNTDFLLSYKNKLNDLLSLSISAGGNTMMQQYNFGGLNADQLAQPGIYQISNSLDPAVAEPLRTNRAINSLYGSGQISLQDKVFLDVTGRNDWSSTLPMQNNSFFYPSVSTSVILSDLFELPKQISFSKFRVSMAQVGNDTRPYQTQKYYDRIYGNNFSNPSVLYNPGLKPEITSSLELGLDIRMFNNRAGLDISVFNNNSRNQILAIPLDPVSGYSNALVNAGLINSQGAELVMSGTWMQKRNVKWTSTLTWSTFRSYVRELTDGITNQVIYAHGSNVSIEARVGGRMGDMYGRGFQRTPSGEIIYGSNGLPAQLDPVLKKWGNAFADWKAGIMNEVTYKNLRFSALVDGQMGGDMYSQTNHKNNTLGKTKVTLPGRDNGLVGDGVVFNATTGKYDRNTMAAQAGAFYDNYYQISNAETNIFDASFLKIREIRLEYTLPAKLISGLGINQCSVAIFGRELFNFTKFPGFDPEGGNLNSGTLTPGVELTQFPSTRNIGLNITLKF